MSQLSVDCSYQFDGGFIEQLVIACTARALFDLEASHQRYVTEGLTAYKTHHQAEEDSDLAPGPAFSLIKKLLALNTNTPLPKQVKVVLVSRMSPELGLRLTTSLLAHDLGITSAIFTQGGHPLPYVQALGADLFLSGNSESTRATLLQGIPAATVFPTVHASKQDQLRIAIDGDCVLFSDEAEAIYRQAGLQAFTRHEQRWADKPLSPGPFKGFLKKIQKLNEAALGGDRQIRTALVTTRAVPTACRVLQTLKAWRLAIDETHFLSGAEKGPFLQSFGADMFFDDHPDNCESASRYVPTCHVPVNRDMMGSAAATSLPVRTRQHG